MEMNKFSDVFHCTMGSLMAVCLTAGYWSSLTVLV